ncbi:MAG: DNA polymerase III subunit epsilon [Arsenophonus endosymbiont of Ceratovacuna japonica]
MSTVITRQVVLDIETTGMNRLGAHYEGHNIIEIGAVEIINRCLTNQHFHVYIKPKRLIDPEAFKIHGISDNFLYNKPTFADIADDLLNFIQGSELIIHNAPFDIGFIDYEFSNLNKDIPKIVKFCKITDSLILARKLFPGKRNNLNSLCDRYNIDNSKRILHGALLDAEILAKIYIIMTRGQISLDFSINLKSNDDIFIDKIKRINKLEKKLNIIFANKEEIATHETILDIIENNSGKTSVWRLNNKKNN